ncbi:SDR family oxidoreductase [Alteromonas pelagimontana]|uniref:SDR family oxidoreductase n=1 Tax=Alteromonas pelagimontana TaxID=1858656 RepID=A0A6M4MEI8_9ALTE|nr:SDR family oxidoreductase [Alteromonas pelagimontana]QJR80576.1 SDR family oxidoreductase [Alteromonas pelagimontana]
MSANKSSKVVIITGASRGIGAATALEFAKNDYAIAINYRTNNAAAEKLQAEVQALGATCIIVKANVAIGSEVTHLFNTVDNELGPVTVLVNNAGILQAQSRMEEIDEARFSHIMQTNVMSCFLCSKAAVERMSYRYGGNGGAIVNVSSAAARTGAPNEYIDYAASKGAMDTITLGLAKEVASQGVRVNGVRPALIYTDMHSDGGEPLRVDRLKAQIPLKRGGRAEEVAKAIYWLASDDASFTTGSFIEVTGGL